MRVGGAGSPVLNDPQDSPPQCRRAEHSLHVPGLTKGHGHRRPGELRGLSSFRKHWAISAERTDLHTGHLPHPLPEDSLCGEFSLQALAALRARAPPWHREMDMGPQAEGIHRSPGPGQTQPGSRGGSMLRLQATPLGTEPLPPRHKGAKGSLVLEQRPRPGRGLCQGQAQDPGLCRMQPLAGEPPAGPHQAEDGGTCPCRSLPQDPGRSEMGRKVSTVMLELPTVRGQRLPVTCRVGSRPPHLLPPQIPPATVAGLSLVLLAKGPCGPGHL